MQADKQIFMLQGKSKPTSVLAAAVLCVQVTCLKQLLAGKGPWLDLGTRLFAVSLW